MTELIEDVLNAVGWKLFMIGDNGVTTSLGFSCGEFSLMIEHNGKDVVCIRPYVVD